MNIELKINDDLFNIAKKYKLEKALIFDKIIYLKLIKSSYEVFIDICLLHLLEMMINDGLVTTYKEKYIATSKGDNLLKELDLLTKGSYRSIDNTEEIITDYFIKKYIACFKDASGKFIKKKSGQTLGSSFNIIKQRMLTFYKTYIDDIELLLKTNNIEIPINQLLIDCTKEYIESQESSNYQYCRRADYFIYKKEANKNATSDLLTAFETYIENIPDNNQTSFDFFNKMNL